MASASTFPGRSGSRVRPFEFGVDIFDENDLLSETAEKIVFAVLARNAVRLPVEKREFEILLVGRHPDDAAGRQPWWTGPVPADR